MITHRLTLTLACAVLLAACGKNSAPRPQQHLIPFAVGKAWSYVYATYDSLGNKTSSRATRTVVSKDTLVGSERWYALKDEGLREEAQPPSFATNRPDGVYLFGKDGEGTLLYKYPAVRGDRCPPFVVVATDTLIDCPAGKFQCYVYEDVTTYTPGPERSFTVVTHDCISPGAGLIRHEAKSVWTDRETGVTTTGPTEISEATAL